MAKPHSELSQETQIIIKGTPCDINKLFDGGNPFEATETQDNTQTAPQTPPVASESNPTAGQAEVNVEQIPF